MPDALRLALAGVLGTATLTGCSGRAPEAAQSSAPHAEASATVPAMPRPAKPKLRLQALGTEPFWSAENHGRIVRYSTPDYVNWTPIAVTRRAEGENVTFTGMYRNLPFELIVAPGKCSDGMSDVVYPMTAQLTVKGEVRRGCARLR